MAIKSIIFYSKNAVVYLLQFDSVSAAFLISSVEILSPLFHSLLENISASSRPSWYKSDLKDKTGSSFIEVI